MANFAAVRLDRSAQAEMSCISGVGGDVPSLVKIAKSGRPILAIDGCSLRCVEHSLGRHGVSPTAQLVLTDLGVKKRFHMQFDESEAVAVYLKALAALESIETSAHAENARPPTQPASSLAGQETSATDLE
jgi:uncharacterized metal-binding protein